MKPYETSSRGKSNAFISVFALLIGGLLFLSILLVSSFAIYQTRIGINSQNYLQTSLLAESKIHLALHQEMLTEELKEHLHQYCLSMGYLDKTFQKTI